MAAPKRNLSVLVDSDAWVALTKKTDAHHQKANKIIEQLEKSGARLLTTNYVFAESITVISRKINQRTALEYIANIKNPESTLSVVWVNDDLELAAIKIFSRQTSKNVSFVDCTNMAVMDQLKTDYIFSFDAIYQKNSYQTIADL